MTKVVNPIDDHGISHTKKPIYGLLRKEMRSIFNSTTCTTRAQHADTYIPGIYLCGCYALPINKVDNTTLVDFWIQISPR